MKKAIAFAFAACVLCLASSIGCGQLDQRCETLVERLQGCFGAAAAAAAAETCEPAAAGLLADMDCASLLEGATAGKQDGGKREGDLNAALAAEIRPVLLKAVEQALREVVAQLPQSLLTLLGGADASLDYYAVLYQSPGEQQAQ